VDLKRDFIFRNSRQSYSGIPVIASNMDTVGTFEMAKALHKVGCSQCMDCLERSQGSLCWFAMHSTKVMWRLKSSDGLSQVMA